MAATLLVETPWTYISATASFNARSTADALLQGRGIEPDAPGLWHLDGQRADPGVDGPGLEAVGVPVRPSDRSYGPAPRACERSSFITSLSSTVTAWARPSKPFSARSSVIRSRAVV